MPRSLSRLAVLLILPLAGCQERPQPHAPPAEFIIAAGDSTFWVTSDSAGVRVRGAPLQLARWDGRFVEIYAVDEDRSYFDAVLIGQRIYRRDLLTNDSMLVFRDTLVPALADRYARQHPGERPLDAEEESAERPGTVATVELELLPAYGSQLSFEYHADVDPQGGDEMHESRRGVLDLRSGEERTLDELFGDSAAAALRIAGRRRFEAALDSALAAEREESTRVARAIGAFDFDPTSFSLLDSARVPLVAFFAPGTGAAGGGLSLPVPPVAAPARPWWAAIAGRLPLPDDSTALRWPRRGYEVVTRYDAAAERLTLTLRDSARVEWRAARLPAPVAQIFWLDEPAIDSTTRRALADAFDEAALYSDEVRSVAYPRPRRRAADARIVPVAAHAGAARRADRPRRPAARRGPRLHPRTSRATP